MNKFKAGDRVRIARCSLPTYWYAQCIGWTFVIEEDQYSHLGGDSSYKFTGPIPVRQGSVGYVGECDLELVDELSGDPRLLTVAQLAAGLKLCDAEVAAIEARRAVFLAVLAENGFGVVSQSVEDTSRQTLRDIVESGYAVKVGDRFECIARYDDFTKGKVYDVKAIDYDGDISVEDDDGDHRYIFNDKQDCWLEVL